MLFRLQEATGSLPAIFAAMRLFVSGSAGYVGTVLCQELTRRGVDFDECDVGFFADAFFSHDSRAQRFTKMDIRDLASGDFTRDSVLVHLAALSNDPLGELDPSVTRNINLQGTRQIAESAKAAGVRRMVFVSTQSVYGISQTASALTEQAKTAPVTEYAKTKLDAEGAVAGLADESFEVIILRPATVFGWSPRFRSDIVFNNLLSSGFAHGQIKVLSDGSPWRPVIHISNLCDMIIAAAVSDASQWSSVVYNVGMEDSFSVRQLAEIARNVLGSADLVFTGEHGADARSYKVDSGRFRRDFAKLLKPMVSLEAGAEQILTAFERYSLTSSALFGGDTVRLSKLQSLRAQGLVNETFEWI